MVLKEPAIWFFSLLNEAFRNDKIEKMHLISIASYPYLDKSGRQEILSRYNSSTYDIIEAMEERAKKASDEDIKKLL